MKVIEILWVITFLAFIIIGIATAIIMIIAIWNLALGHESKIFNLPIAIATAFTSLFFLFIAIILNGIKEEWDKL